MTPLEQKLNQLSLTTMSRQLETTLADAAGKNLSCAATLESLADLELEARNSRAIERRFRCSRLQAQHSASTLSLQASQEPHRRPRTAILRLLDLELSRQRHQR